MGAPVSLRNVTKQYHDTYALRDLSLEIGAGEFLTLLGPSGSGKSTTLMIIAGIVPPTSGRTSIDGEDITDLPPHRRNIGVVFQNYALFPNMTVFGNIAFPLRRRGVPSREVDARVREALDLVHLSGLEHRRIGELSGGQQQRVALARALVFRPPLLLMDEPLGALDKKLREHMQTEIKRITETVGITAIYVTHDQEEALTLSDRIAVLRAGTLEQLGTPEELYHAPATAFVAAFVGQTNLIEGEVIATEDGVARVRTRAGLEFRASRATGRGGNSVTVSLRPERIRLLPATDDGRSSDERANLITGTIRDKIFAGGVVRFQVVAGQHEFLVCVGNDGDVAKLRKGDQVRLRWQPEDAQVVSEAHPNNGEDQPGGRA